MTDKSPIVGREVYYRGEVQGVGFRFNARRIAQGFAVTGFVRNLPDGRVHLVAEGDRSEVERFLAAVARSMEGNIEEAAVAETTASGRYASFEIRM